MLECSKHFATRITLLAALKFTQAGTKNGIKISVEVERAASDNTVTIMTRGYSFSLSNM
jgi:hypothetical protein